MQVRKIRSPAEAMALLLLTSVATGADITVCSIAANRTSFDHQNVSLQGAVVSLRETTSRAGNDFTTFKLQDGGCDVNIFIWGHPALTNGDHVRVEGVFETEHHQGRYTFYNEVEATKASPAPR
jgi:uncharacterized protein YdeI (BOF family)